MSLSTTHWWRARVRWCDDDKFSSIASSPDVRKRFSGDATEEEKRSKIDATWNTLSRMYQKSLPWLPFHLSHELKTKFNIHDFFSAFHFTVSRRATRAHTSPYALHWSFYLLFGCCLAVPPNEWWARRCWNVKHLSTAKTTQKKKKKERERERGRQRARAFKNVRAKENTKTVWILNLHTVLFVIFLASPFYKYTRRPLNTHRQWNRSSIRV